MPPCPPTRPSAAAANESQAGACDGPAPAAACLNCGEPLALPTPRKAARYCPACGQETNIKPPTLMEFVQQFGGAYLATEGALWRSLKLLLLKPGALTREYLEGRRRRYVLPLRLYLTVSVLVLLLLRLTAHISIQAPDGVRMDAPPTRNAVISIGVGKAGMKDGVFFCEGLPAWLCQRVQRRLDVKPEAFVDMIRDMSERFVANIGASLFVLLPVFALGMKLVYLNRRLRYTEHLVFALHAHAFWFLALALCLLPFDWVKLPALMMVPAYTLQAMRRVYGGRWWPRWLRAALVMVLYAMTMLLALTGVGLWSFLS
jgi:hypothetical protein